MTTTLQPLKPAGAGSPLRSRNQLNACEVVCICGGVGYPYGSGSPARITVVGKALQEAGMRFRLLHCGPSPNPRNTERRGTHEGVAFEYTSGVKRPDNPLARALVYLWAVAGVTWKLIQLRRQRERTAIWLYIFEASMNLYLSTLCRLLGLPVILELCEWWPSEVTYCSRFTKWAHEGPMFASATGALVISRLIGQRVVRNSAGVNPNILVHRLPAIVDSTRFASPAAKTSPWFVWCGGELWIDDVHFLVRAVAAAKRQGFDCPLLIVGTFSPTQRARVMSRIPGSGLEEGAISFTGFVDDRTLEEYYHTAQALMLPLKDNERSRTRMPNKLGEYLASGRPVITSAVGDLAEFLVDGENACLARPHDAEDFARQMISVLRDPERAKRIGAAGVECCQAHLDYRSHSEPLANWFAGCMERGR